MTTHGLKRETLYTSEPTSDFYLSEESNITIGDDPVSPEINAITYSLKKYINQYKLTITKYYNKATT